MRTIRQAPAPATVNAAGELDGLLLPWNTAARVADALGGPAYTEEWAPGSLAPAAVVPVYASHRHTVTGELERGPLIGRATRLENRPDGLYGTLALAATPDAQNTRELARTVGAHLSVEFDISDTPPPPGAHIVRTAGQLTGVAVILPPARPAFPTAAVTAVRTGETTMPATVAPADRHTLGRSAPEPLEPDPAAAGWTYATAGGRSSAEPLEPDPMPEPDDDDPDDDDDGEPTGEHPVAGRAAVAELVRSEIARVTVPRGRVAAHPLARYGRFVDAADAAYTSPEIAHTLARALADQITTDNPGVIPPGWLTEVRGIVDLGRRVITGLGTNPDPGEGMDINWPYFDGDLATLVGPQATEKAPIVSVKVSLKKGTEPLATYAGGSDVSYQLIRRSSPSYRDAYLRIMAAAYAAVTEAAATAQLAAGAGGSIDYDLAADADGAAFRAAVFAASVDVEAATGQPASRVFAATDVFVKLGGAMTPAPVVNVGGTATASTLRVDVSGLDVTHAPTLAAGTAIVTNPAAAAWAEDGPQTITAEDVEKLGQNIAVWGMGALAVFVPAGVVLLSNTVARRSAK